MALSTFRVDGLQEEMIWEIGQNEIASKAGRSLKGRCDLPTQVYTTCGLTADFDNQPLRHVNTDLMEDLGRRLRLEDEQRAFLDFPSDPFPGVHQRFAH